ncbi:hypothetical protein LSTR_LSTR014232 [Laodelphax striatellus]|uniref:methylated diphthine methylhydrolase n=1 Tax=Laodelphax striatellus TaxID=195883 RepID=A0A482XSF4_LAOST|nr:hypothetical protein LSTR_LSTR014232 [Laodelphax striatellus]
MKEFRPHVWWDTVFSADSVEWCPDEEFAHILLCGTYKLEENSSESDSSVPQTRVGLLHLMRLSETLELKLVKTLETTGILDIKWSPFRINGSVAFAIADAVGTVSLYTVIETEGQYDLLLCTQCKIEHNDKENIALSIDWSQTSEGKLAVSDSNGYISVLTFNSSDVSLTSQWNAHSFEAWIVAFDFINDSVVYSGGDDSKMCVFDVRTPDQALKLSSKSVNSSGVTSLHSSNEGMLASGSYDESVHIWDSRLMKRSVGSLDTSGGGVWRLKWHPTTKSIRKDYLLAACMHGGFKVIDCRDVADINVVASFTEHESLAYGADWCYLPRSSNSSNLLDKFPINSDSSGKMYSDIIATCSFYDHKLCLSTIDID